jgi:hypothetical protein
MRQVLPELLDTLPHHDPAARRSREELRMVNRIMGNHRWVCRSLLEQALRGDRILELGAGDGDLARQAWGAGIVPPAQWGALDLAPAPTDWPSEAIWLQRELFTLPVLPEAEVIVANLFLHHFEDEQLADLGKRLPDSCRVLLACEPARRWVHSLQGHLLSALVGLSAVTHHDMLVSIRAGFSGEELPRALGLNGWKTQVSTSVLGAYRLTAWR